MNQLLTLKALCQEYGFNPSWVYKKTAARAIPHLKKGGLFFVRAEIDAWLEQGRVRTTQEITAAIYAPLSPTASG